MPVVARAGGNRWAAAPRAKARRSPQQAGGEGPNLVSHGNYGRDVAADITWQSVEGIEDDDSVATGNMEVHKRVRAFFLMCAYVCIGDPTRADVQTPLNTSDKIFGLGQCTYQGPAPPT